MSSLSIIITAGGIGKRMNSPIPKQFILVKNKPILMHTIERFYHYDKTAQILVTLPKDWWDYWQELTEKFDFKVPIQLVEGGKERYDSIKSALDFVKGEVVAIHDGVRPCVSEETIAHGVTCARSGQFVVPVLPLKESIRKGSFEDSQAMDRSLFFSVQTPQCFPTTVLMKAYEQSFSPVFTDDASLVEKLGEKITLINGNPENIKITEPIDLQIIDLFL